MLRAGGARAGQEVTSPGVPRNGSGGGASDSPARVPIAAIGMRDVVAAADLVRVRSPSRVARVGTERGSDGAPSASRRVGAPLPTSPRLVQAASSSVAARRWIAGSHLRRPWWNRLLYRPASDRPATATPQFRQSTCGKRGWSHAPDRSVVDQLGRVGRVGRCRLREPVGHVRRLCRCCRIIMHKPGVRRPAPGWPGCLRAVDVEAQTCLPRPASWRLDAIAHPRAERAIRGRSVRYL